MASLKQSIQKHLLSKPTKPYFLVIGAGRGGTSLLAAMLDYNIRLSLGFEAFSVPYLMGEALPEGQKFKLDERLTQFASHCQKSANACDVLWGNKITTEQIASLAQCEGTSWPDYMQHFVKKIIGNQKVIFILRDGRTCVDSKMRRTGQPYEAAVERWKTSIRIWEFLKQNSKVVHTITYETLLAEPEKVLRSACAFLEIQFDANMQNGTNNANMPAEYRGEKLRQAPDLAHFPAQWTIDLQPELSTAGYKP